MIKRETMFGEMRRVMRGRVAQGLAIVSLLLVTPSRANVRGSWSKYSWPRQSIPTTL